MTPSRGQRLFLSNSSEHFPNEYVYVIDTADGEEYDICVSRTKHGVDALEVQWVKSEWAVIVDAPPDRFEQPTPKRRGRKPGTKVTKRTSAEAVDTSISTEAETLTSVVNVKVREMTYPFPLDNSQVATLHLPSRLSRRDASRLNQFISALVLEVQEND